MTNAFLADALIFNIPIMTLLACLGAFCGITVSLLGKQASVRQEIQAFDPYVTTTILTDILLHIMMTVCLACFSVFLLDLAVSLQNSDEVKTSLI